MVEFINLIFEGVGLPIVLSLSDLSSYISSALNWFSLLNPQILFSIIFYFMCSYGIFSLTLVLLYRTVKKMVHYPHKKGCEYK